MTNRTWTNHTAVCISCHSTFRISQEALDEMLQEMEGTQEEAVAAFEFCLACTDGETHDGEKVETIKTYKAFNREGEEIRVTIPEND
jgi:hypothetical protein